MSIPRSYPRACVFALLTALTACYRSDPPPSDDTGTSAAQTTSTSTAESSAGSESSSTPTRYSSCKSGSDAECMGDELCVDPLATCGVEPCQGDRDCPAPNHGTAVQACPDGACVLVCGTDFRCPPGMECVMEPDVGEQSYCRWP